MLLEESTAVSCVHFLENARLSFDWAVTALVCLHVRVRVKSTPKMLANAKLKACVLRKTSGMGHASGEAMVCRHVLAAAS